MAVKSGFVASRIQDWNARSGQQNPAPSSLPAEQAAKPVRSYNSHRSRLPIPGGIDPLKPLSAPRHRQPSTSSLRYRDIQEPEPNLPLTKDREPNEYRNLPASQPKRASSPVLSLSYDPSTRNFPTNTHEDSKARSTSIPSSVTRARGSSALVTAPSPVLLPDHLISQPETYPRTTASHLSTHGRRRTQAFANPASRRRSRPWEKSSEIDARRRNRPVVRRDCGHVEQVAVLSVPGSRRTSLIPTPSVATKVVPAPDDCEHKGDVMYNGDTVSGLCAKCEGAAPSDLALSSESVESSEIDEDSCSDTPLIQDRRRPQESEYCPGDVAVEQNSRTGNQSIFRSESLRPAEANVLTNAAPRPQHAQHTITAGLEPSSHLQEQSIELQGDDSFPTGTKKLSPTASPRIHSSPTRRRSLEKRLDEAINEIEHPNVTHDDPGVVTGWPSDWTPPQSRTLIHQDTYLTGPRTGVESTRNDPGLLADQLERQRQSLQHTRLSENNSSKLSEQPRDLNWKTRRYGNGLSQIKERSRNCDCGLRQEELYQALDTIQDTLADHSRILNALQASIPGLIEISRFALAEKRQPGQPERRARRRSTFRSTDREELGTELGTCFPCHKVSVPCRRDTRSVEDIAELRRGMIRLRTLGKATASRQCRSAPPKPRQAASFTDLGEPLRRVDSRVSDTAFEAVAGRRCGNHSCTSSTSSSSLIIQPTTCKATKPCQVEGFSTAHYGDVQRMSSIPGDFPITPEIRPQAFDTSRPWKIPVKPANDSLGHFRATSEHIDIRPREEQINIVDYADKSQNTSVLPDARAELRHVTQRTPLGPEDLHPRGRPFSRDLSSPGSSNSRVVWSRRLRTSRKPYSFICAGVCVHTTPPNHQSFRSTSILNGSAKLDRGIKPPHHSAVEQAWDQGLRKSDKEQARLVRRVRSSNRSQFSEPRRHESMDYSNRDLQRLDQTDLEDAFKQEEQAELAKHVQTGKHGRPRRQMLEDQAKFEEKVQAEKKPSQRSHLETRKWSKTSGTAELQGADGIARHNSRVKEVEFADRARPEALGRIEQALPEEGASNQQLNHVEQATRKSGSATVETISQPQDTGRIVAVRPGGHADSKDRRHREEPVRYGCCSAVGIKLTLVNVDHFRPSRSYEDKG